MNACPVEDSTGFAKDAVVCHSDLAEGLECASSEIGGGNCGKEVGVDRADSEDEVGCNSSKSEKGGSIIAEDKGEGGTGGSKEGGRGERAGRFRLFPSDGLSLGRPW